MATFFLPYPDVLFPAAVAVLTWSDLIYSELIREPFLE